MPLIWSLYLDLHQLIAIALKDWFMSIFGWFVIMTSGAVRVGDRIRVSRDGYEMVGDVLDISLFKMIVREDVTLTTYTKTRRSEGWFLCQITIFLQI